MTDRTGGERITAQIGERLRFGGDVHELFAEPLHGHDGSAGPLPQFVFTNAACWRGYVGTREFRDDVLHLVDIEGCVADGRLPVGMAEVFPDHPSGVRAGRVTDLLRAPVGELLDYVLAGYASTYDRDLRFGVVGGRLVYVEESDNRTNPPGVTSRDIRPGIDNVFGPGEAAFFRVAVADTADPTLRLVFADWLDEQGDLRGHTSGRLRPRRRGTG